MTEQWLNTNVGRFEKYLDLELQLLKAEGVTYYIVYEFLETTLKRIKLYIQENMGRNQERELYLGRVAAIVRHQAARYDWTDGSFWEDFTGKLNSFAEEIPQIQPRAN